MWLIVSRVIRGPWLLIYRLDSDLQCSSTRNKICLQKTTLSGGQGQHRNATQNKLGEVSSPTLPDYTINTKARPTDATS